MLLVTRHARMIALSSLLALGAALGTGCVVDTGSSSSDITDVPQTDVERQSIGNCWLYAEASWVESMHLAATGEKFDVSQSYWTYWHWFGQITDGWISGEISTGGNQYTSNDLIRDRGIMPEAKFVPEDAQGEMSYAQSRALSTINTELKSGRLKDSAARHDGKLVRQVLDEAWGLSDAVRAELDTAFGPEGDKTLTTGAATAGTDIIAPQDFAVQYTERLTDPNVGTVKKTDLVAAMADWHEESYPSWGSGDELDQDRRTFQIRVQKALHDAQPVVITWDVDFNAMESYDEALRGSFNMTTLNKAGGPGHQGGHMTVLEDYDAITEQYGELKAGVTLDPSNPDDKAKLDAALLPSTVIKFFRIKNSWGAFRDDRSSAPGFPGYHDLYMDYMNGPITFCPDVEGAKTPENCSGTTVPFNSVALPPGY
jgi:hypothetical protein